MRKIELPVMRQNVKDAVERVISAVRAGDVTVATSTWERWVTPDLAQIYELLHPQSTGLIIGQKNTPAQNAAWVVRIFGVNLLDSAQVRCLSFKGLYNRWAKNHTREGSTFPTSLLKPSQLNHETGDIGKRMLGYGVQLTLSYDKELVLATYLPSFTPVTDVADVTGEPPTEQYLRNVELFHKDKPVAPLKKAKAAEPQLLATAVPAPAAKHEPLLQEPVDEELLEEELELM